MFKISDWFKLILCTVLSSGVATAGNFGQMNFAYWKIPPVSTVTVTYLVVAGGGGGGSRFGGGGGAGGLLSSTATLAIGTTYTITVGTGGNGAVAPDTGITGAVGNNSVISGTGLTTITAIGGGGGGDGVRRKSRHDAGYWPDARASGSLGGGAPFCRGPDRVLRRPQSTGKHGKRQVVSVPVLALE